jgi:ribonuclease J
LISHPHQDHYGLLEETPADWPVYCGAATAKLISLTSGILGRPIVRDFRAWKSEKPFVIGPFTITPFLTDHSAFDAYMLLIEVEHKRILYSGDFRVHGRKAALVRRFIAAPPPDIDVLLIEGTNLGSDKSWMSESDLETDFVALFKATPGRVFVAWSAQNIDRTVTLYRACLQSARTLVIDLYTAEVLDLLRDHSRLPQPDWPQVKVVVTRAFAKMYRDKDREAFVERMVRHGIAARKLGESLRSWVAMIRPSLIRDYQAAGVVPNSNDAWCWSMWTGYLKNNDGARVQAWFETRDVRAAHIHTSGHASPSDLRAFATAVNPKMVVPVHGVKWDQESHGFGAVRRLADGVVLVLP